MFAFLIEYGLSIKSKNYFQDWSFKSSKFPKSSIEVFCENGAQRYSLKKVLLKILYLAPVLGPLFNKVTGIKPATLLKRDSSTGVFLWNLRDF